MSGRLSEGDEIVSDNLERHLHLVLDGRITYAAFVAATKAEYERMALYLRRRWIPPASYEVSDVVQELLLGTWFCVWEWVPGRGPSLSRYVIYNAMSSAKRALHKARGAKLSGSADRNPSHYEHTFSSFGNDGEGDLLAETLLAEEPIAETILIEQEERAEIQRAAVEGALAACHSDTERAVIRALAAGGGLEEGVEVIYADIDQRLSMRLMSEAHALRVVTRTARTVLERQQAAS